MKAIESAIAKTLAYSDIFDYPLTATELHRFLISPRKIAAADLPRRQYYYLPGRKNLISLRKKRYRFSQLKLKQIQPLVNLLKFIPSIRLVAVTGALAMNNADEFDDIDLMIIAKANRLWLTRLITLLILEISGSLRRFGQAIVNNKICPNLWLDETALTIPSHLRNLYTAHEIAQLKPLFDRFKTYQQFVSANLWVKIFLPNALKGRSFTGDPAESRVGTAKLEGASLLDKLESLFFRLQYWYMKRKITNEKVGRHSAFFHPRSTAKIVLRQYFTKLKQLGINGKN